MTRPARLLSVTLAAIACSSPSDKPSSASGAEATDSASAGTTDDGSTSDSESSTTSPPSTGLEVGLTAPDFSLPDADGNLVALSDYRGSRIIVMGNAEWCPSCQDLAPKMQEWYVNAAEADQIVISVIIEDSTGAVADVETAARWRDRFGLGYPVLADVDGQWLENYSAGGSTPQRTYVVLDSSGTVTWLQADGSRVRRGDLVDAINAAE